MTEVSPCFSGVGILSVNITGAKTMVVTLGNLFKLQKINYLVVL